MWIVRFALHRPYTFVVLAMFVTLVGVLTIARIDGMLVEPVDG
jgi:hypothetical protein